MLITITSIAVALGRGASRPEAPRLVESPRYQPLSGHLLPGDVHLLPSTRHHALDLSTGEVLRPLLPQPDYISQAAVSPWRDDQGRFHVVGQWRDMSGLKHAGARRAIGLARYTLPDGEVLDRIELDLITEGTPCWAPDGTPRVVVAGVDGRLYSLGFEREGDGTGLDEARSIPRPLDWRVAAPGPTNVRLWEPTWPIDLRLAGTLVVSLAVLERIGGEPVWAPCRLWWLRLDPSGTAIVAAGRLIDPAASRASESRVAEERLPCVSATADGGLAIAYMAREEGYPGLTLRMAPLSIDPETGTPSVREADSARMAVDRSPTAPAFSTDGRWVYSLPRASAVPPRLDRSSVDDSVVGRSPRYAMSPDRPSGRASDSRH